MIQKCRSNEILDGSNVVEKYVDQIFSWNIYCIWHGIDSRILRLVCEAAAEEANVKWDFMAKKNESSSRIQVVKIPWLAFIDITTLGSSSSTEIQGVQDKSHGQYIQQTVDAVQKGLLIIVRASAHRSRMKSSRSKIPKIVFGLRGR